MADLQMGAPLTVAGVGFFVIHNLEMDRRMRQETALGGMETVMLDARAKQRFLLTKIIDVTVIHV